MYAWGRALLSQGLCSSPGIHCPSLSSASQFIPPNAEYPLPVPARECSHPQSCSCVCLVTQQISSTAQETEVGENSSSLSALWGDSSELRALCSKSGQGWLQAKAGRSLHTMPPPPQNSAWSCAQW